MPMSTQPFQKSPNSAWGADNRTILSGRCITPTFASMPAIPPVPACRDDEGGDHPTRQTTIM